MRTVILALWIGTSPAWAQVADRIPRQAAGDVALFGAEALRIRGGPRVEVEPVAEGFLALLLMHPDGRLELKHAGPAAARRQGFDIPRPARGSGGDGRVPFVTRTTDARGNPTPMQPMGPVPGPRAAGPTPIDGILLLITDIALDSADITTRLAEVPSLEADSVAAHVGRWLVAGRNARWAAYYQKR